MGSRDLPIREEISKKIREITQNRVGQLGELWGRDFGEKVKEQHLKALVGHVQEFFDDIYEESSNRMEAIVKKNKILRDEAESLKQLLGVDFNLNSSPDLPYYSVQLELEQKLEELRSQLNARRNLIRSYLEEQQELVESMDEKSRPLLNDPLPSVEEMSNFRRYLDDLRKERARRNGVIGKLRQSINRYVHDLQIELEHTNLDYNDKIQPTIRNITELEHTEQELSQQFQDMKTKIDDYRAKLDVLWEFLQISHATRQKFQKFKLYNQNTYDMLYQEFNRCESMKRENIEEYVHKIRLEIIHFWDLCYKSTGERKTFSPFQSQVYDEELLSLHEMELTELKDFYEKYKVIFDMYEEKKQLWEKVDALEEKKIDPNRYNNRGGQLLKEEKERNIINARIPKLESQLLEMCAEYENRTNKPFTIEGRTVQSIINEHYEKREEHKGTRKKVAGSTSMSVSRNGSALRNMTRDNVMSATPTTFLPVISSHTKPVAKRHLMTSSSVAHTMRSVLKTKSPTKGLKRRAIKHLDIKTNKRKERNNYRTHPVTSGTSVNSESSSYNLFEKYVSTNAPLHSSVLPEIQSSSPSPGAL